MTSKHTKGPWFRNIRAGGKYPTVFAGRNNHVAVVQQQESADETEANIDLIAAAPELLEALRSCVDSMELYHQDNEVGVGSFLVPLDRARAIIAEATGESV
jgi:hypothetical protein